jgi:hypothetical protein
MVSKQFSHVVSRLCLAAALALAAGSTALHAQTPAAAGHHETAVEPGGAQSGATMADRHQAMMAGRKEMMARMAAADQKLAELVARMNAATGDEKITAITAVVTELAAQRKQMQQQMMAMQTGMMEQMMAHMSAMHGMGGMMKKAPEPAPQADDPSQTDHRDHHSEK